MKRAWIAGLVAWVVAGPAGAAAPGFINYQARLTDSAGAPLSGTQSLVFRVYNAVTAGTQLASGGVTATATSGLLSALIPAWADIFTGSSAWLEVQVGSEILGPRSQLVTVPYAFQAEQSADKETLLTFRLLGVSVVKANVDGVAVAPFNGTIVSVNLYRRTAGSSGSTIVDVNKNGTTVFTTQANRPAVTTAQSQATAANMDVTSVSAGDVLSVDVDQVEGGSPEDIVVSVRVRKG